ncbi:hypothetical protein EXIGLDRAFT_734888 [Exidia glandulosa HHB12029]|uniref:Uncharacterized protein n=1 Tax=Exidia glandulosa HHB12029 TaxID=1314781 RepID=A0A165K1R0_EXIGL|nr:hypothetical protein EXIGLDRAFT_734888 [Exidia glandulosa HHB12029]
MPGRTLPSPIQPLYYEPGIAREQAHTRSPGWIKAIQGENIIYRPGWHVQFMDAYGCRTGRIEYWPKDGWYQVTVTTAKSSCTSPADVLVVPHANIIHYKPS